MSKAKETQVLVKDWRQGWKWVSSWALALIIFLTTVPLPDELLNAIPEPLRVQLLGAIAVVGLVMRFVKQPTLKQ